MSSEQQDHAQQEEKTQRGRKRERWLALLLLILLVSCCVFTATSLTPYLLVQRVDTQLAAAELDYGPWSLGAAIPFDYQGLATAISSEAGQVFGPGLLPPPVTETSLPAPTAIPSETPSPTPSATQRPAGGPALPTPTPTLPPTASPLPSATIDPGPPITAAPPTATPVTPPPITQTDLSITISDARLYVAPGHLLEFTITASNSGPLAATGAAISSAFDTDFDLAGLTWTCTGAGGGLCGAGAGGGGNLAATANLPVGGSVTYTLRVSVSTLATVGAMSSSATVTVPLGMADSDTTNNMRSDTNTSIVSGFVVTNTGNSTDSNLADDLCGDGGVAPLNCSLRAAIAEANTITPGTALTIYFDIPGAGPHTINASGLSVTRGDISIDGTSQAGYTAGYPVVSVVGSGAGNAIQFSNAAAGRVQGLRLSNWATALLLLGNSDDAVITDNVIVSSTFAVYTSALAGNARIEGNIIGTDATGIGGLGNGTGVYLLGTSAIVRNNTISGSSIAGLVVDNSASGALIEQNRIGTDPTGMSAVPNLVGARVLSGNTTLNNNTISGNGDNGLIVTNGASNVTISNNRLGVNAAETAALGNALRGILFDYAGSNIVVTGNTVGGSGAGHSGIRIEGNSSLMSVSGNYFGITSGGLSVGNSHNGIYVYDSTHVTVQNNVFANNGHNGVRVDGVSSRIGILQNSFFDNTLLGIELESGTNNSILAPAILSWTAVDVTVELNGAAGSYRIDLYSSPSGALDPEGRTHLYNETLVHGGGVASHVLAFSLPAPIILTATVTDSSNNTSEFSTIVNIP